MFSRVLASLACVLVLTLGCQAKEKGTIVARFGDETVTLTELDAWIKDDLFARQTSGGNPAQIYDLRRRALDELVKQRVLRAEAARRNLTEQDLIDAEVAAMGELSDEKVAQFYEDRIDQMDGQSLEEVAPRIRDHLMNLRAQRAMEKIARSVNAEIFLERPRVDVAADGPSKGPANAPVTIIEFSDFQCPFCSRALPVIEEVMTRYPNEVRFVYRHLPLDRIHPRARIAAEASLCAHDQGRFWDYHDLIFANATTLGDEDLKRFAEELNLDVAAWEQCVAERKFAEKIDADIAAAASAGIAGTPAFTINGVLFSGAKPVEDFVSVIESELERGKARESSESPEDAG
jgi:protein-disulfide isomerase